MSKSPFTIAELEQSIIRWLAPRIKTVVVSARSGLPEILLFEEPPHVVRKAWAARADATLAHEQLIEAVAILPVFSEEGLLSRFQDLKVDVEAAIEKRDTSGIWAAVDAWIARTFSNAVILPSCRDAMPSDDGINPRSCS